jgi:hypothetical protein
MRGVIFISLMKDKLIAISLAAFLCALSGHGERTLEYQAVVSAISENHAVIVTNKILQGGASMNGRFEIPLAGVAAGTEAQMPSAVSNFLTGALVGKVAQFIEHTDRDKSYGAWIYTAEYTNSINLMLIESGLACRTRHLSFSSAIDSEGKNQAAQMEAAELRAKQRSIGIWSTTNAAEHSHAGHH